MDISVATLAATVVGSFLVPYIKKGAEKVVQTVGEKLGEAAGEGSMGIAAKLWTKVQAAFGSPQDKVVLSQFQQRPDAAKGLVEAMLKEKLEEDEALAADLHELVKKATAAGVSTGAHVENADNVGIADARQADLSHSSGAQIIGLKVGEFPTKKP
jgi:hypothetical protein